MSVAACPCHTEEIPCTLPVFLRGGHSRAARAGGVVRYTLRVMAPLPHFHCVTGDALVFELGGACIWRVHQPAGDTMTLVERLPPNWGFLAGALAMDEVEVLTPSVAPLDVLQAIGWAGPLRPLPPHQPPRRHPPHLRVVR